MTDLEATSEFVGRLHPATSGRSRVLGFSAPAFSSDDDDPPLAYYLEVIRLNAARRLQQAECEVRVLRRYLTLAAVKNPEGIAPMTEAKAKVVCDAFAKCGGNVRRTAAVLRVSRATVYRYLISAMSGQRAL